MISCLCQDIIQVITSSNIKKSQKFWTKYLHPKILASEMLCGPKFIREQFFGFYNESGSSVSCKFKYYLKIDFHDCMTIRILLCYLLPSDSNVASVGRSVRKITIGVPFLGNHYE